MPEHLTDLELEWEDGTYWTFSWFEDAGCFMVDRWIPENDDFDFDNIIDTPADCTYSLFETLDTVEEAIGRPLPPDMRDTLQAWSEARPIDPEYLEGWNEWNAFAIVRKVPDGEWIEPFVKPGEWIETFAPPGAPDPFAYHWIPEATLFEWGLL